MFKEYILENNMILFNMNLISQLGVVMDKITLYNRKQTLLPFVRANLGKISQREIARRLGIGNTTVRNWAKELGFIFKKHTVNENYFFNMNPEAAYILGFIYADGNISWNTKKGYYSMTITAAAKDKDHLEKMREMMQITKPLTYGKSTHSYRLIANSKMLCLSLMKLGVFPRKSKTVKFPKIIPKKLMKHFLRGVIDGDGCIRWVSRKRSPYFEISIASGSKAFAEGFIKAVETLTGIPTKIKKRDNIFLMRYTCTRGENLARYVYSEDGIHLSRKKEHFIKCLEERHNGK